MSQNLRAVAAGALGACIIAVAVISVRPGPVAGAPSDTANPPPRTITVSGTGKITVVPDVARVNLGVTLSRPTVKAARDDAAKSMTAIIGALKALGIADADIQTTGLSLNPQYANGTPTKVVGYTINEQLQVTVRDLDKAGDVVDSATARGANDVNGIWFEVSDPAKAQNDARAAAMTAARASAQALATAGNVSLGMVMTVGDATPVFQGYYPYAGSRAAAADLATPVQSGTQDVTATVTVVFAIS